MGKVLGGHPTRWDGRRRGLPERSEYLELPERARVRGRRRRGLPGRLRLRRQRKRLWLRRRPALHELSGRLRRRHALLLC